MRRKYTQTAVRTVELYREIVVDIPDGTVIDTDILNDCLSDGFEITEWQNTDDYFEPDTIEHELTDEEPDVYYAEYIGGSHAVVNKRLQEQSRE